MGKQLIKTYDQHELSCENQDAPICGNETCSKRSNIIDEGKKLKIKKTLSCSTSKLREDSNVRKIDESSIQELFIVGAGPHALTLLLRLLEPDPDFLTDKVRHIHAESPKLMRPFREVYRHIKDIARGPNATLKPKKKKGSKKKHSQNGMIGKNKESLVPPALTLNTVLNSVQVVDSNGDLFPCCYHAFGHPDRPKVYLEQFESLQSTWQSKKSCNPICAESCGVKH